MTTASYTYRPELTPREKEVLMYIAEGLSSKQIAAKLAIKENTIINHNRNMLLKTGTRNNEELVRKLSKEVGARRL